MSSGPNPLIDLSGKGLATLNADEDGFLRLAVLLKAWTGIDLKLSHKNLSLMASRLWKVLVTRGFENYGSYADWLERSDESGRREFISSLTTNTTHFFRESEHFEKLAAVLPELIQRKLKRPHPELRIWCAAASTGQEPYTILMTVLETLGPNLKLPLKFLATDIDTTVLDHAMHGIYPPSQLETIPSQLIEKYFVRLQDSESGDAYQVKSEYRAMIRFVPFNLMTEAYPFRYGFDVIFCRNVLIYFDAPTSAGVVEKLAAQLHKDGLLFLGHSECGSVQTRALTSVQVAAYRKIA